VDLLLRILGALGEGSPWLLIVASNLTWPALILRAIISDRAHLREQCAARFRVMEDRLAEKDAYILRLEGRSERWERVALTNTETAVRSAAVVEKVVDKAIGPVS
jgi:hypothetical protein